MGKDSEMEESSEPFENIENLFQKELESLPEVAAYIERLQSIILRQRKILVRFYAERRTKTDASTQTDTEEQTDIPETSVSTSKPAVDDWSMGSEKLGLSITEQVAQAAESAMKQTSFVYEQTSGMYYDYNTGYYYNAELGLYYDGNTGTYYYYDEARKTYHFHSKVESNVTPDLTNETSSQIKQHSETTIEKEKFSEESVKQGKKIDDDFLEGFKKLSIRTTLRQYASGNFSFQPKATKRKQCEDEEEKENIKKLKPGEALEEGECSDSDSDSVKNDDIPKIDAETKDEDSSRKSPEPSEIPTTETQSFEDLPNLEISKQYPPCMRLIVQETSVTGLKIGSLFMITWPGGTLGREGDHSILLPDFNVSKYHAKFSFSGENENGNYVLVDLGSKNGTYLDGKRLSVALSESDPFPVEHGSIIQVGSTQLLCHIHEGQETCESCEPGVIINEDKKKPINFVSREEKYKSELKRLKHRYGVESLKNSQSNPAPGYEDKADIRRKTVGSTSDSVKTEVASVQESIPSENKGFKMLAKMGWNKGQALGKEEKSDSITEPILVFQRAAKAGLGSESSVPTKSLDAKETKKQELWRKTQQRFKKLK